MRCVVSYVLCVMRFELHAVCRVLSYMLRNHALWVISCDTRVVSYVSWVICCELYVVKRSRLTVLHNVDWTMKVNHYARMFVFIFVHSFNDVISTE
jgi:hypothetical protein